MLPPNCEAAAQINLEMLSFFTTLRRDISRELISSLQSRKRRSFKCSRSNGVRKRLFSTPRKSLVWMDFDQIPCANKHRVVTNETKLIGLFILVRFFPATTDTLCHRFLSISWRDHRSRENDDEIKAFFFRGWNSFSAQYPRKATRL